ncbi:hypothetical protein Pcinc_027597 [Petrolisthes cinctipes]|uniref:DNA oxidative demethylase ALKBH2 n=1 Tax=Petrolisthes cinctipes TaxID=88211 RepID=A0AAE1K8K4_PETCI|nr:hypothetical protein Pcinc_027597 [Petrolisthes cinctipes]
MSGTWQCSPAELEVHLGFRESNPQSKHAEFLGPPFLTVCCLLPSFSRLDMDRFLMRNVTKGTTTVKRKKSLDNDDDVETAEDTETMQRSQKISKKNNFDDENEPQTERIETLCQTFSEILTTDLVWKKVIKSNLDLSHTILFSKGIANTVMELLEEEVVYFTGDLAKVQVFGRWHNIPRKQATYGDPGLTYKYSGKETPGRAWPPVVKAVRDLVNRVTGYHYNFVLINRYKDGQDKMGEHKDDERELHPDTPIASLSLGQTRDFYFRHQDTRPPKKLNIDKVQMPLHHGTLLLMNPPTNRYWYHALPPRATAKGVRVNLTFRKVVPAAASSSSNNKQ